jgi:hypothetical protein
MMKGRRELTAPLHRSGDKRVVQASAISGWALRRALMINVNAV